MSAYKKLLVAIDLTEEAPQVLDKAKAMSDVDGASLALVHVVEPVGYACYGGDIPMDFNDIQDQLDKAAREQLATYTRNTALTTRLSRLVVPNPRFTELVELIWSL